MLIFDRICPPPQLCVQFQCLDDLLRMVDIFGQPFTLSEVADNVSVALGVLYQVFFISIEAVAGI